MTSNQAPACSSESGDEGNVSYLFLEDGKEKFESVVAPVEGEDAVKGPYEQMEEFMQPKLEETAKQGMLKKMISGGAP